METQAVMHQIIFLEKHIRPMRWGKKGLLFVNKNVCVFHDTQQIKRFTANQIFFVSRVFLLHNATVFAVNTNYFKAT